jgi:hypothetical protein
MHLSPKALLLPAILLVMPASLAQEIHDSDHPELMARLSSRDHHSRPSLLLD